MTIIVGTIQDGTVILGADSASSTADMVQLKAQSKVFRKGAMLIGIAGNPRAGQLLNHTFEPPPHPDHLDALAYLVGPWMNEVRDCFKAHGFSRSREGQETNAGFSMLLGYRGRLFVVYDDFQVFESVLSYQAIGSGRAYALGALMVLQYCTALTPAERVQTALTVAAGFNPYCAGPFHLLTLAASED